VKPLRGPAILLLPRCYVVEVREAPNSLWSLEGRAEPFEARSTPGDLGANTLQKGAAVDTPRNWYDNVGRVTEQARRTRLRDRAADQILEMLISGGLNPGERLPPERELCARLNVSRTVVREALNLLEARGLISIEHGRGAVVSGGNIGAVRDTLGLILRVRPKALWELLEIRNILEVEIAGLAAERAGKEDGRAMRIQLERMLASIDAPEGYVEADVEFHSLLARATCNEVLLTMLEPVVDLLREGRQVSASRPGSALRALGEHEEILRRVEVGDTEGARREMRAHLANTAKDIEAVLGEGALDKEPRGREDV
jgi:GntR family transcriptional regulator, transcriptional repressor for pyruvate dehydrogenase complex